MAPSSSAACRPGVTELRGRRCILYNHRALNAILERQQEHVRLNAVTKLKVFELSV
jgi:hypothetical protein